MKLQRKLFARRDYEGLTDAEKYTLSQERSKIAKELSKARSKISKSYQGHVNEIEKIAEDDVRKNILNPDNKGIPDWIDKNKKFRTEKAVKVKNSRYDKAISEARSKASSMRSKIKDGKIKLIQDPKKLEEAAQLLKEKKLKIAKKAVIGTAIGASAIGLTAAGVKAYKKKKESDKMKETRELVYKKK